MRWVRFQRSGRSCYGVMEGNSVEEVSGDIFGGFERTGRRHTLDDLTLLPPVMPPTFYAAGLNYVTHLREIAERTGEKVQTPPFPNVGYRAVNALIGHDAPIVIPRDSSGKVQFEGELVVVIGRRARNLSETDALSCVFGYTIGNDVSERSWQKSDRTFWRAKNADTFKPMGPWIETDFDLNSAITTVRVNSKEVSKFRTKDMLFGIASHISTITRYITLHPGDVIWMGTEEPTLDMVPGDTVEVEITGIGTLRNPVVAET